MKGTIKGALALISLASLAGATFAGSLDGNLYAVDSSRALSEVNMTTGEKTAIGSVSSNAGTTAGLAYNAANNTVYVTSSSNDSLYTLDVTTGAATLVGAYGVEAAVVMHGLEWNDNNSTLYGSSSHNGGLYTINTTTGAATLVGTNGLTSFNNLVFAQNTNTMYGTNSSTDSFYSVDLSTGGYSLIGLIGGSTNPNSMAFNTMTNTIFMADNSTDNLYTIDPATGAGTVVGSMGAGNILGLVYIPPSVPTVTVTGNLTLLDTVAGPGYSRNITVDLEFGGNTYTTVAAISGVGTYTINIPQSLLGIAVIKADGSSFLRSTGTISLNGNNVTKDLNFRNGDVDNSGEVDAADIDLVIAAFGSTGQPVEDVDMSGEVDAADIDIVIANFGQTDD